MKILNIIGCCIKAMMIAVACSLMLGLTVVIFYRHIPTFGMDPVERAIVIQNDGLNAGLMYIGLFLVSLVFILVREYIKYK